MPASRAVASFACNSRNQFVKLQIPPPQSFGRVTAEASPKFLWLHNSSQSVSQGLGHSWGMADSDIQATDAAEKTNSALVIGPVIQNEVCLSNLANTITKRPDNGRRDGVDTVSHRVRNPVADFCNRVTIRSVAEVESRMRLKDRGAGRQLQGT